MRENNGRWWRTPSLSVEDVLKMSFALGPILAGAIWFWRVFGGVPADVTTIKETMATREQVQSLVVQINDVNRAEDARMRKVEKMVKILDQYPEYRDIEVYHNARRHQWDWDR